MMLMEQGESHPYKAIKQFITKIKIEVGIICSDSLKKIIGKKVIKIIISPICLKS